MNQKSTTEGSIVLGTKTQAYESPTKQVLAHDKQSRLIKFLWFLWSIGAQPETDELNISLEDH